MIWIWLTTSSLMVSSSSRNTLNTEYASTIDVTFAEFVDDELKDFQLLFLSFLFIINEWGKDEIIQFSFLFFSCCFSRFSLKFFTHTQARRRRGTWNAWFFDFFYFTKFLMNHLTSFWLLNSFTNVDVFTFHTVEWEKMGENWIFCVVMSLAKCCIFSKNWKIWNFWRDF